MPGKIAADAGNFLRVSQSAYCIAVVEQAERGKVYVWIFFHYWWGMKHFLFMAAITLLASCFLSLASGRLLW
jgi:hypothetical protein